MFLSKTRNLMMFLPFYVNTWVEEGLYLGVDEYGRNVYIPWSLPSLHGVILGPTGSGKTTLAKAIAVRLAEKYPVIVVDPHMDWGNVADYVVDLSRDGLDLWENASDRDYREWVIRSNLRGIDFKNILSILTAGLELKTS